MSGFYANERADGWSQGRGLAPGFKLERPTVNDSIERERGRFDPLRDWNLWSSVGDEETTQPAAAVVAAGDVRGAGSGGHFLGQGAAEARAPSLDRCA